MSLILILSYRLKLIPMFYIVLKFKELLISLEPVVGLQWGMR